MRFRPMSLGKDAKPAPILADFELIPKQPRESIGGRGPNVDGKPGNT